MNQRIRDTAEAAARLFLQQGYAKTQISHIAKQVGVSVGAIYLDFAGKQEILHFFLKCTIDPGFADRAFQRPITDELFSGLEGEIIRALEQTAMEFAAPLERQDRDYGFADFVSDAFDLLARYAVGCLFIEKNQYDFPALASSYRVYRKNFQDTVERYLEFFIARGQVRPLEHVELSAVLIIELLSWWAMDMRYVSFETSDIPLDLAKRVCMDNLLTAYGI